MKQTGFAYIVDGNSLHTLDRFSEIPVSQAAKAVNSFRQERSSGKDSAKLSIFPYGPSSGGMVESVYFDILTEGEKIEDIRYDTDFKNRTMKFTGLSMEEALLRMERMNGVHAASYSSLFCQICEKAMDMEITDDIKNLRVAMMEAERISSHLFVVSRLTGGASQNIAHMNTLLLRENLLRAIATAFGHRYFFGVNRIGGTGRPVNVKELGEQVMRISEEYGEIYHTLMDSRVFMDRLDRSAIIKGEKSSGPVMRGSGIKRDGRSSHRYYEGLQFNVPTSNGGDALARFIVRSEEIVESASLIEQAISGIGNVKLGSPEVHEVEGNIWGGFMETPSGDASLILKIKSGHLEGIGFRSPSILNMEAFAESIHGNTFADFLFGYESLGIWVSEMGDFQ